MQGRQGSLLYFNENSILFPKIPQDIHGAPGKLYYVILCGVATLYTCRIMYYIIPRHHSPREAREWCQNGPKSEIPRV